MNRSIPAALLAALLGAAACADGAGPSPTPASIRLEPGALALDDGAAGQLTATVLDRDGAAIERLPAGAALSWSVTNPTVAEVDDAGRVTALRPGATGVTARLGELRSPAAMVTVRAVAAAIDRLDGDDQRGIAGATLERPLLVSVRDRFGNSVAGREVRFRAVAGGGTVTPAAIQTDSDGLARARWTLGAEVGEQRAEAVLDGVAGAVASFAARAADPSLSPAIEGVTPDTLRPGVAFVVRGRNFDASATGNALSVGGVPVPVVAATATELRGVMPPAGRLPCRPAARLEVAVRALGFGVAVQHPARIGARHDLAPGEAVALDSAERACAEVGGGGEYVVSVVNVGSAAGAAPFRLVGAGGAPNGTAAAAAPALSLAPGRAAPREVPAWLREQRARRAEHARRLDESLGLMRRMAGRGARPAPVRSTRGADAALRAVPQVGEMLSMKVPQACDSYATARARAVYVGARSIVLEDSVAPLAGTMDADYRALAEEFERDMWPIVVEHYGDPLLLDERTDANGRVVMLFSPRVNDEGDILGYVWGGDFFAPDDPDPALRCAGSNRAEIFYGIVPTVAEGIGAGSRDRWMRQIRGTVIHEVKHITSFAYRLAPFFLQGDAGIAVEERWLEEATAMAAEEIWARKVFGFQRGANTGFDASLRCELERADPACAGKPAAMLSHFAFLGDYFADVERLSPLYNPGVDTDASFYGSGWLLARWAADHSGRSDAQFFRELNQETRLTGMDNLVARLGRSAGSLLTDWTVANLLDDRGGFAPARPEHAHPSWNTRDVLTRLNQAAGWWPRSFPLAVRPLAYGAIDHAVPAGVRAGSAAYFEPAGVAPAAQTFGLRGPRAGEGEDTEPAATLRLVVVRVR